MKHLVEMPGLVEVARGERKAGRFPWTAKLSQGELAAVRRQFDLVPVVSNAAELKRLRARLEAILPLTALQRSDCEKAIASLALTELNEAGNHCVGPVILNNL